MVSYSNKLDLKRFMQMLDDTTECYKFYWFDAILSLMAENRLEMEFDEIINRMIADVWYSISEYHLCLGLKDGTGKIMNSLQRAVEKLIENTELEPDAGREKIIAEIKKNSKLIKEEKYQISKMAPYRLLSPFLNDVDGNNKIWNQKKRLIAYIKIMDEKNSLPYIIEDAVSLKKKVRISEQWKQMLLDYMIPIRSWIKFKKVKYLQDRNPGVLGIIYKLEPENEKQRKLQNVRKLWAAVIDTTGISDIYSGRLLEKKNYEIDHFVPWSFITNDEMWNLMPVNSSFNSSKRDKLPDWERYFVRFAQNQFRLNEMIYTHEKLAHLFGECQRDNLNALWSLEELYIKNIERDRFVRILEDRLKPIYDSAKTQGYGIWLAG